MNAPAVARTSDRPNTGPMRDFSPSSSFSHSSSAPDQDATDMRIALQGGGSNLISYLGATVVLELSKDEPTRYSRIAADTATVEALFVDLFLDAHVKAPAQITLDL